MTNTMPITQRIRFFWYGIAMEFYHDIGLKFRSQKCLRKGVAYMDKRWKMMNEYFKNDEL